MSIIVRNNIKIYGEGKKTLMFAHGFGCSQNMWSRIVPDLEDEFRIILFDLVGSGDSDTKAYDREKYDKLSGYGDDVIEIIESLGFGKVIYVGHSVSAMIGVDAAVKRPDLFEKLVMVAPSPCYLKKGDYNGGFEQSGIDSILSAVENNYSAWAVTIAQILTGNHPEQGPLLAKSFCRTQNDIAKHFARVTFTSDSREELSKVSVPSVILQCSEDAIVPEGVGSFMHKQIDRSVLVKLRATGHCPHLTHPQEVLDVLYMMLKS
jgi:sigma-B regulation protein RsbQ